MLKLKRLLSRKQSNGESKKKPTGAAAPTAGAGAPATTAAPEPVAAMPASPAMHALSRLDEVGLKREISLHSSTLLWLVSAIPGARSPLSPSGTPQGEGSVP